MRKVPNINTHIFKQPHIPWSLISDEAKLMLEAYGDLGIPLAGIERSEMIIYVNSEANSPNHERKDYETLFPLAGVNALVDYIGGKTATNNGATFDINGATFAGAEWIDSNYNPAIDGVNYIQDNALMGSFIPSGVDGFLFGNNFGSGRVGIRYEDLAFRINEGDAVLSAGAPSSNELIVITRTASNVDSVFVDGINIFNGTKVSTGINSENVFIGGLNSGGLIAPYDGIISTFVAGAAIGFDHSAYKTNLVTLLTALGTLP